MAEESKFKRVVLKLSGEALAGEKGFGIDPEIVDSIAKQIQDVTECGLQVLERYGQGNCRLYGDARNRNKLAGIAGCTGKPRRSYTCADRY